MSLEQLLTVDEAAMLLSVCDDTVRALVNARRLACVRVGRGKKPLMRFREADLEAFIERNRIDAEQRDAAAAAGPIRMARRRKPLNLPEAKRYA